MPMSHEQGVNLRRVFDNVVHDLNKIEGEIPDNALDALVMFEFLYYFGSVKRDRSEQFVEVMKQVNELLKPE